MLAPTPTGAPSALYIMIHAQPQQISINGHNPAVGVCSTRHPSLYRVQSRVMPTR
jgi:hypothetical protein